MPRETVLVQRNGSGNRKPMSPDGIKDLWKDLLGADPEILGIVVEVDDEYELPPMYKERELDNAYQTAD